MFTYQLWLLASINHDRACWLLTFLHKWKGREGSLDPQLSIQPLPSAICMQLCPKHTWLWASQGEASTYRLKKTKRGSIMWPWRNQSSRLSRADALGSHILLPTTPQPCSIIKPNTLISSHWWTLVISNFDLSVTGTLGGATTPRLTSSLHAHTQKKHFWVDDYCHYSVDNDQRHSNTLSSKRFTRTFYFNCICKSFFYLFVYWNVYYVGESPYHRRSKDNSVELVLSFHL